MSLVPSHIPSLSELSQNLRNGAMSPADLVAELMERFEADRQIHSFVPEPHRRERLLREAEELVTRHPDPGARSPLFAVPVGIKDIIHTDGFDTAAGSPIDPEKLRGTQASCVDRLRRAGALIVGKAACTELAYFGPGPTRNPLNPEHTPGGSSSGSAAAVAMGLSALTLGSQTIGSIGRPAAFCGVVGFKPSYGRIPTDGVVPLAASADHLGTFTTDVAGAALASSVLIDDWRPATPPEPTRPVLAIPDGPYLDHASALGRERFDDTCERLRSADFEIREIPIMADFEPMADRHRRLVAAEAFRAHGRWLPDYGAELHPKTVELLEVGRTVAQDEIDEARRSRLELRRLLDRTLAEHGAHLWLSPAAPGPAPEGLGSTGDPIMNLPWTHSGVPTLVVPDGRAPAGSCSLPTGLQLAAAFGRDERLLAWAAPIADLLRSQDLPESQ